MAVILLWYLVIYHLHNHKSGKPFSQSFLLPVITTFIITYICIYTVISSPKAQCKLYILFPL